MRLIHLVFAVAVVGFVLTLSRDPIGRVFVIVFCTGLGEIVIGLASVMALFQTLGAFGEAKGVPAHCEALAATTMVLTLATALMSAWLFVGVWLVVTLV